MWDKGGINILLERAIPHTVAHITRSSKVIKSQVAFRTQTYLSSGYKIKLKLVLSISELQRKKASVDCQSNKLPPFIITWAYCVSLKPGNSSPDQYCIRMVLPAWICMVDTFFSQCKKHDARSTCCCLLRDVLCLLPTLTQKSNLAGTFHLNH